MTFETAGISDIYVSISPTVDTPLTTFVILGEAFMRRQRAKGEVSIQKRWKKALKTLSKRLPHLRRDLRAKAANLMNSRFSLAVIVFLGAGLASMARLAHETRASEP